MRYQHAICKLVESVFRLTYPRSTGECGEDPVFKSRPAAVESRCFAATACVLFGVVLGGCAALRGPAVPAAVEGAAPGSALGPTGPARGRPIASAAAQVLDTAPTGGRFRYRLADGRPASFALGPLFQSALGVPCRIGRVNPGDLRSAGPADYPFCQYHDRWYEMTPVVVSGY